ncbi:MAG: hypothetical protein H0V70_04915 [Ktedonobacteraceae bacterium]|nr:hypothetical protein [Ktedonobacteraceae bacterium]
MCQNTINTSEVCESIIQVADRATRIQPPARCLFLLAVILHTSPQAMEPESK